MIKQPEFKEFKDIKVVVVSRSDFETSVKNHFVVKSPKEAIERLKDFSSVIVAGGGILNLSFLKENLIDEIYIDTEPVVFSPGIKLFEGEEVEKRLELVGTKMFSKNGTQAHYKVIK